ncbi:MAG: diacylglycerol kinase family protein, partial [Patescibacteria group bacterium]|nr:diacylglycerol kinase family protein [Patescibacteria group bacterium]
QILEYVNKDGDTKTEFQELRDFIVTSSIKQINDNMVIIASIEENMKKLIHQHTISFRHAFEGLFWAFKTQPNFRIHFLFSFIALFLGYFFQITKTEWVIIVFTIVLGITGELLNTSIEAMTDLITNEWRKEAKIAKDVAAGMMLFIAFGAIVVALIIFGPYSINYILS